MRAALLYFCRFTGCNLCSGLEKNAFLNPGLSILATLILSVPMARMVGKFKNRHSTLTHWCALAICGHGHKLPWFLPVANQHSNWIPASSKNGKIMATEFAIETMAR